jgi:hypothetical protein
MSDDSHGTAKGVPSRLAYAWDSAREVSYAPAVERHGLSMDTLRRWLPMVAPLTFAALLLVGVLLIARSPHGRVTIAPARLALLVGVLLLAGAALWLALKRATSDAAVVALLGLGAAVEIVLTVAVLAGVRAGLLALLIVAAVGAVLVSRQLHRVAPETAAITTLAGQHSRTLLPATHVLLPGETVLTTLPTGSRTYATPPLRVTTARGAPLQASARMRYHLIPEQAHRALHADAQWDRTLNRLLAETVLEELARGAGVRDAEPLRADVERLMRDYGSSRGIRIEWVRLEGVVLGAAAAAPGQMAAPAATAPTAAPPHALATPRAPSTVPLPVAAPAALSTGSPVLPRAISTATTTAMMPAGVSSDAEAPRNPPAPRWWERPRQALHALGDSLSAHAPATPPNASEGEPSGTSAPAVGAPPGPPAAAEPDEAPLPSADVLTAAYEAVREGRINDPATVRQVADGFMRLAESERLSSALDFDPERAAQMLMQRAQMLSDPSRTPDEEPGDQHAPGSPPAPSRDDNVIRGG